MGHYLWRGTFIMFPLTAAQTVRDYSLRTHVQHFSQIKLEREVLGFMKSVDVLPIGKAQFKKGLSLGVYVGFILRQLFTLGNR